MSIQGLDGRNYYSREEYQDDLGIRPQSGSASKVNQQELDKIRQDKIRQATFDRAVDEARRILRRGGACSKFFGHTAVSALNHMAANTTFKNLGNTNVGITGDLSQVPKIPGRPGGIPPVLKLENGEVSYPFLKTIEFKVNEEGAFFKNTAGLPRFGGYAPGSLGSQLIQIFHELGHILVTDETHTRGVLPPLVEKGYVLRETLLPSDGGNTALSEANTNRVHKNCIHEISLQVIVDSPVEPEKKPVLIPYRRDEAAVNRAFNYLARLASFGGGASPKRTHVEVIVLDDDEPQPQL